MEKTHQTISTLKSFASLSISDTNLDFGPEFAKEKEPGEYVATVNHHLQLHEDDRINRLHILFTPQDMFASDLENWIAFAVRKGVEDLILDFSTGSDCESAEPFNRGKQFKLPSCIFSCKTLTSLTLSHCVFNPPQVFSGFPHLKSLTLSNLPILDDVLQRIMSSSPSLESLFIRFCSSHDILHVSSQSLQRLVIVNPSPEIYDIDINTPRLRSFIYYGEHIFGDVVSSPKNHFTDISSLTDAYISSISLEHTEPEHDYIKLLSEIKQVRVLTVCTATLLNVTIYGDEFAHENLPVMLENLEELQLLMEVMNDEYLSYIHGFFRHCPSPCLKKLFILLPASGDQIRTYDGSEWMVESSDVALKHLKAIKIVNFKGLASEMKLLRFLLERSSVLETMMIVVPSKNAQDDSESSMIDEKGLYEQISLFPRASLAANIILLDSLKDDNSLEPTHREHFHET